VSGAPPRKADAATTPAAPLPEDLLRRPKTGFSVPVSEWVPGDAGEGRSRVRGLRSWARRTLPSQPRQFRALVLVTDAFGANGGIAKFNRDFLAAMAAMPACAEAVVMPRLVPDAPGIVPERISIRAGAGGGKLRFALAAVREAMRGPFDLVVAGHINLMAPAALAARIAGARSLLVVHGIDAWSPHPSRLARAGMARLDRVIGVSKLTLERFAAWARIDPARFRVLPNCVDLGKFAPGPKPADLLRQFGLERRTVLMTLGRLAGDERYKGFDEVIEALPALARQVPDICYLICGDGTDRARLEEKARALGVADRVVFAGFVPEERKADYFRLADAYVMPSTGEGFGIVHLEALASGIPTLGSTRDGSREALLEGELGELVDPSDKSQVLNGIVKTLSRPKGVPAALQQYSEAAFRGRVGVIVAETLA